MSKPITSEILPKNLREHRAVQIWSGLQPERVEPEKIEILKRKRKTVVYRLVGVGPGGSAVIAKKCLARTGAVERIIYQELLPRLPVPALRCYGFLPEPEGEFVWLFLEDAGTHVYSPANEEHRALAGAWMATVHGTRISADLQALLPDRGPGYYLQLLRSARATLLARVDNPALSAAEVTLLRTLTAQYNLIEEHWEELEKDWEGFPSTLVHGDFVIKNLRVRTGATGPALLVFDWEMAGWGVPATDLAQSVGKTASPNLDVYRAVFQQDPHQLDGLDIQRLAIYGNLLRVLDKIFWETFIMDSDSYEFLIKPLTTLRGYKPQLAAALGAINWSRHD
jgi:hypothetical protein